MFLERHGAGNFLNCCGLDIKMLYFVRMCTYQLEERPEHAVHSLLGDDHGTTIKADTSAGADTEENGVLDLSVVHELDDLVQKNTHRGDPHAVLQK